MTIGSDNVFPKLITAMQTTDQAAPSDSSWKLYAKAGGIYARSSNAIVGPFVAATSVAAAVGVRVRHSTTQSVSNNTLTALNLDTETFDTDAFHDTVTNNTRLTVPSGKAGKYLITGTIEYANNTTGVRAAEIRLNGTTMIAADTRMANTGTNTTLCHITMIYALAVGDYVELVAYQSSGGALNSASTSDVSPVFTMELIGT